MNNKNDFIERRKQPLKSAVEVALDHYLSSLDGEKPAMVYDMVIKEVEEALLSKIMAYTEQNQSHAAEYLGLNRGTLRKKLKEHKLL